MTKAKMTLGQLVDILSILWKVLFNQEIEWDGVSCETAQAIVKGDPKSFARQFILFLANGGRVILGGLKIACASLNPGEFIGANWAFWKGPKDGNGLAGEEERDKKALSLTEVDFDNVNFLTCLKKGESPITGEENLIRLRKLSRTLYGTTQFMGLWQDYKSCQNKAESVLEKLYQQKGITRIYFFGDVLRDSLGSRYVLCLCRVDDGQWSWDYSWLDNVFFDGNPAACS